MRSKWTKLLFTHSENVETWEIQNQSSVPYFGIFDSDHRNTPKLISQIPSLLGLRVENMKMDPLLISTGVI